MRSTRVLTKKPMSPSSSVATVGDGSADEQIVLAAVAPQQGGKGRQQRHEKGDALPSAQGT